jgi:hypothetical protein
VFGRVQQWAMVYSDDPNQELLTQRGDMGKNIGRLQAAKP